MKAVTCYKADSGRLYETAQEAYRDDAIVSISHTVGIPYEMAEKILKNYAKIESTMIEFYKAVEDRLID